MRYLVDTNVFSEVQRGANCHPGVRSWWAAQSESNLFLSVLVLGEVRRGIHKMERKEPSRALKIERWLISGFQLFSDRILTVDTAVASVWGKITSERSLPVVDSLLAATAIHHGMTLVTRNTRDIEHTGVKFLNPFYEPF